MYKIFGVFVICSEVSRSVTEMGTGAADPRTKKTIKNIVTIPLTVLGIALYCIMVVIVVFALNAVRKQAYRFFWLTHQAGGRYLCWVGVTWDRRALPGLGGRYMGQEGVTWARRALHGTGGRCLG
jgi:hypothetical protein